MARILLLSDLHGNRTATEKMAEEIRQIAPDRLIFLGDAVGKGPCSDFTCDWVRENCDTVIGGNWDYGVGGKIFAPDGFFWDQLGEERLKWLRELPREGELRLSGLTFRLVHGRPVHPLMQAGDPDETLVPLFTLPNGKTYDGAIFGDSHRPFFRTVGGAYIINSGSVGSNLGGIPRAHAILLEGDTEAKEKTSFRCTVISTVYDNEAEAEIARRVPELPKQAAYIREVLTGHYSR